MCSGPWHWTGFRLEALADVTVRSVCVIHETLVLGEVCDNRKKVRV